MKPNYIIDCAECGSQLWRFLDDDEEIIRVQCTYCNLSVVKENYG